MEINKIEIWIETISNTQKLFKYGACLLIMSKILENIEKFGGDEVAVQHILYGISILLKQIELTGKCVEEQNILEGLEKNFYDKDTDDRQHR